MSVHEFFSEGRKLVDARKAHLARMGMASEHVEALRMPDPLEAPRAPPVHAERLPPANAATYETPKLPKLPGVNVGAEE